MKESSECMNVKAVILDEKSIQRATTRIAHEILEKNKDVTDIILVGIKTRGVPLAERLSQKIKEIEGEKIPVLFLDITLYRDDLTQMKNQPVVNEDINMDLSRKTIILVDDVIYTGRTVRAALDAIIKRGRPSRVQLAVLIDRGHRELPIRADYVGKNLPTSKEENVKVSLKETDSEDKVVIME